MAIGERPDSGTKDDQPRRDVGRRAFLVATGGALIGLTWYHFDQMKPAHADPAPKGPPKSVNIVEFTDAGQKKGKVSVPMIQKQEAEWKAQLTPLAFEVTRHAGTERAFSGDLLNVHDKGIFRCICCDTALFNSATKFESGTGWPSFYEPIAKENVNETIDLSLGMQRTAVSCRRCDAHLGHVFDDGPRPTGLRYCMNSAAMRFAKA